jgi:acylphosphatase
MSRQIRAEIIVSGLVQGVGYRYYVLRKARALNVTGYVKNLPTGEVLCIVEGELHEVEELFAAMKIGPFGAHVNKFTIDRTEASGEFHTFEVRH